MKISGIYMIRNIINNRIYIGSSYNVYKRINTHFNLLRNDKHTNSDLQNDFNNFSESNFCHDLLEIVEERQILEREYWYIDKFKDFCYNKIKNIRSTDIVNDFTTEELERFWLLFNIRTDFDKCWEYKNGKQRPTFHFRDSCLLASRIAYTLCYGEIENNLVVCHECDNPLCVNPRHLSLGSYQDNSIDTRDRSGRFKFTMEIATEIRELHNIGGKTRKEIEDIIYDKYKLRIANKYINNILGNHIFYDPKYIQKDREFKFKKEHIDWIRERAKDINRTARSIQKEFIEKFDLYLDETTLSRIIYNDQYKDVNYKPIKNKKELNRWTNEQIKEMRDLSITKTSREIIDIFKEKYNLKINFTWLSSVLNNSTNFDPNYIPNHIDKKSGLNDELVKWCRKLYNDGFGAYKICGILLSKYDVSITKSSMTSILKNKTWKDSNYIPRL